MYKPKRSIRINTLLLQLNQVSAVFVSERAEARLSGQQSIRYRKEYEFLSRIYAFLRRKESTVVDWKLTSKVSHSWGC